MFLLQARTHARTRAPASQHTVQVSLQALGRTQLLRLLTPLPRILKRKGSNVLGVFGCRELWEKTKVRRAVKVHRWLAFWRVRCPVRPPARHEQSSRCCATAEIWERFFRNSILRVVKISLASSLEVSPLLFCSIPSTWDTELPRNSTKWPLPPVL